VADAPTETQTVRAQAKWVRMSARKGRVVAEHIRGRSVPEARAVLAFTPRAAAREIEKVLASAVANAEANHGLNGDDLIVHAAVVDDGPTLKRWRARARGRVARIKKHTCHITVLLAPVAHEGPPEVAEAPRRAKPAVEALEAAEEAAPPEGETTEEPKDEQTDQPEKTEAESEQAEKPKPRRVPRRKKTEE
jgi:large subunit ribosomal protein L22